MTVYKHIVRVFSEENEVLCERKFDLQYNAEYWCKSFNEFSQDDTEKAVYVGWIEEFPEEMDNE